MKKTTRILSLMLAIILCVGMLVLPANAATDRSTKAKALWSLGLFKGYDESGNNFGLTDKATREQALVFLIRLLGEDKAATAWTGATPYTDVPAGSWAKPYIGYAKEKGYTVGIGNNEFGFGRNASMREMTMFVLRGLGYSDSSAVGDFTWNNCVTVAKQKGILDSDEIITPFTRGVAVDILFGTIGTNIKNQNYSLVEKLASMGVVTEAQCNEFLKIVEGEPTTVEKSDLAAGTYAMKCQGKYLRINSGKLEIRDTTPAQTFTVASSGNYCTIKTEDGKYLSLTSMTAGTQLTTSTSAFLWLIQKQSAGVYTIRPAENTNMVVNANSAGTANGTKMIIGKSSGTPSTALITVTIPTAEETDIKGTFKVSNRTGKSIVDLYIADSSASGYGDDYLTKNKYGTFANKKYVNIPFEFDKNTSFDFYIRFKDGSEAEATGLSFAKATSKGGRIILEAAKVTLTDGSTTLSSVKLTETKAAEQTPVITEKTVTIYNMTGKTWTGLYSSSVLVDSWGENLSSGSVTDNSSLKVVFPVTTDEYKFDLKAAYSGGEYIFEGLDMSKVSSGATLYLYLDGTTPVISDTKPVASNPDERIVTMTIVNSTGKTFTAIYSTSNMDTSWGTTDLLAGDDFGEITLEFPITSDITKYDLKFVETPEVSHIISNLDFSAASGKVTVELTWNGSNVICTQIG